MVAAVNGGRVGRIPGARARGTTYLGTATRRDAGRRRRSPRAHVRATGTMARSVGSTAKATGTVVRGQPDVRRCDPLPYFTGRLAHRKTVVFGQVVFLLLFNSISFHLSLTRFYIYSRCLN